MIKIWLRTEHVSDDTAVKVVMQSDALAEDVISMARDVLSLPREGGTLTLRHSPSGAEIPLSAPLTDLHNETIVVCHDCESPRRPNLTNLSPPAPDADAMSETMTDLTVTSMMSRGPLSSRRRPRRSLMQQQSDGPIEYTPSDALTPIPTATDRFVTSTVDRLRVRGVAEIPQGSWEAQFEAITACRRLVVHHRNKLSAPFLLNNLIQGITACLRSLRSAVAKNALMAT